MATQAQIDGGLRGRDEGHDFEKTVRLNKDGRFPSDMLDIWGERTTTSKTDVVTEDYNYSIKNSQTSTQIQVCSVNRFCRLFNIDDNLKFNSISSLVTMAILKIKIFLKSIAKKFGELIQDIYHRNMRLEGIEYWVLI